MKFSEWRRGFAEKYRQYIDELSTLGVETAQSVYSSATGSPGNSDVTVDREFDGGVNFKIIASGHDAAFLEFGTGVATSVSPNFNVQAAFPIEAWSWSDAAGHHARDNGGWYYNGEFLEGTPPYPGMQEACITMQFQSPDIARRVFR